MDGLIKHLKEADVPLMSAQPYKETRATIRQAIDRIETQAAEIKRLKADHRIAADLIIELMKRSARQREALTAMDGHLNHLQGIVVKHLTGQLRKDDFISAIIWNLDGPEQREVQTTARQALQETANDPA